MSESPTGPAAPVTGTGNSPPPAGPPTGVAEKTTQSELEKTNKDRIGEISDRIREAVRAALPTPPEQFLTLMVPGKVVTLEDFKVDKEHDVVLSHKTELNQAILCDDMPTLSTLQMGPTGKSVARSYSEVISKLVPSQSTIGVDENSMTPAQARYDQGMKFLSSPIPGQPGKTVIGIYTEKQHAYTKVVEDRLKAFDNALQNARADPRNEHVDQVQQAYEKWVDENARTYRNYVQAAYMDWVVSGKKEQVEYWFAVVDQDTAMARVERSKEAMRLEAIQDQDGSSEYLKVKLEPSDWANKCLDKISAGSKQTETADWYSWEITRLEKVNAVLGALKNTSVPTGDQNGTELEKKRTDTQKQLQDAIGSSISAHNSYRAAVKDKKGEAEALEKYNTAQRTVNSLQEEYDKIKLSQLSLANKEAHNEMLGDISKSFAQAQIKDNEDLIEKYKTKIKDLAKNGADKGEAINAAVGDAGIPNPVPNPAKASPPPDFFTPITVEVSASSQNKTSKSSATAFSAGGSATWGLGSVSASVSHSEAHSQASSEMASSEVKISLECMRVDIKRSWLNPELFYDPDLTSGPNFKISPGFTRLRQLMEKPETIKGSEAELSMYSTFPLYPTAFLVACNVVLEISGSTSSLQTYMNSSSTSASASVSYGPFSVSGSGAHSSDDAGSRCQSTASGCRIEIKSPQIIAWISEMVPALPRLPSSTSKDLVTNSE